MLRNVRSSLIAVGLVLGGLAAAAAANTTFFTSIGDIVFPFTPPTSAGAAGAIDNMTIGATTPRPATITNLVVTGTVSGASLNSLTSPGPIGSVAPGTGAFTTLSASGAVSGAGFSAYLASPPAIGGTTPAAITSTTLTATDAVALSPASHNVVISPTGTGVVTINPATAGTMNNVAIGGTGPLTGAFTAVTAAYVTATTFFNASTANTLTAAGTSRTDALALTKAINVVTSTPSGTGVVLPSAANVGEGGTVIVFNQDGGQALKVYAAGSNTIDGTAGATGVTLGISKRCAFTVVGGVFISAQLGAVSG